ncbi:hypothetical protein DIT68_12615 [Brumimicrobium oceani]|uniref:Uncharacterized protein n=1 Tax=Brumimicrobium oceani TaxID=2100725 RepID=A0A2U2XAI2_9FLAO|nr:hypothetical protein DIT68_12615 [Brumimicrobium oceani]
MREALISKLPSSSVNVCLISLYPPGRLSDSDFINWTFNPEYVVSVIGLTTYPLIVTFLPNFVQENSRKAKTIDI